MAQHWKNSNSGGNVLVTATHEACTESSPKLQRRPANEFSESDRCLRNRKSILVNELAVRHFLTLRRIRESK